MMIIKDITNWIKENISKEDATTIIGILGLFLMASAVLYFIIAYLPFVIAIFALGLIMFMIAGFILSNS